MTFKYYVFVEEPGAARIEPMAERLEAFSDFVPQNSLLGSMAEAWTLWDRIDEFEGDSSR